MQSNDETSDSSDAEANTSKSQDNKIKSMTKAETFMLLDLIAKSQILHCKSGKSAAHVLKNQEWERISKLFNSRTKTPRSLKQLRLKWDNLKKFARQPANRAKPSHHDLIVRVLDIINDTTTLNESQINEKLLFEMNNLDKTSEINNISDDLNMDRSQNDEVTEDIIMMEKKAREINKPMTNIETSLLVDLIGKSQVLHCKSGKAAANELKIQEWQRICKLLNSITKTQRTPKQLRIKWENMKKFAKQQDRKSKQYTTPRRSDIVGKVLNIINNPKTFMEGKINFEHYDSPEIDFWRSNANNKTLEIRIKSQEKAKSMNKQETNTLLDFIESSTIFNSAESFSNQVKRKEWCRISKDFNKTKGVTEPRTPKQLCVRWDNLKKAAQKQTFTFQRDNTLERVRAILKNRNKSIEQNESDDDDILSDVNNYVDTSFSDTEADPNLNLDDTESLTNHSINTTDEVQPLSEEETNVLLDLIAESQILNKDINPNTNEMKVKEWKRISNRFNTIVGAEHTADQLRSQWENLKANAKKKNVVLEENGKSPFEVSSILDRVSSILKKFEINESNRSIVNEEDPLDISYEISVKVESEQDVDEDDSIDDNRITFTRRETKILVTLVKWNKVINNKRKNIYSHEEKQREWLRIAKRFNAIALPQVPRNSQQLFMKWEKLKRQARKWKALMKMKNLQIRNSKKNEILDDVSFLQGDENFNRNTISTLQHSKKPALDKAKPMTDEETKTLLALIERSKIIKEWRRYTPSDKLTEWLRITKLFNSAKTTRIHRTLRQLRFKWDNLKRSGRKYYMSMMAKDPDGNDYIVEPNETLDRVVNFLRASKKANIEITKQMNQTTDNFHNKSLKTEDYLSKHTKDNNLNNISFKTEHLSTFIDVIESEIENSYTVDDLSEFSPEWYSIAKKFSAQIGIRKTAEQLQRDWSVLNETASSMNKNRQMPTQIPKDILHRVSTILQRYSNVVSNHGTIEEPQSTIFKTEVLYEPSDGNSSNGDNSTEQMQDPKDCQKEKESSSHRESRISKNTAIAEYFAVKKKIAEAKLNRILLENEKLKLEIDLLKSREN